MRKMDAMGREPCFAAHGTTATDGYPTSLKRIAINSAQWRGDKARKSFINWRRYSKPG
ncbi:hypothetical protein ACVXG9_15885 [Escherichia coli]